MRSSTTPTGPDRRLRETWREITTATATSPATWQRSRILCPRWRSPAFPKLGDGYLFPGRYSGLIKIGLKEAVVPLLRKGFVNIAEGTGWKGNPVAGTAMGKSRRCPGTASGQVDEAISIAQDILKIFPRGWQGAPSQSGRDVHQPKIATTDATKGIPGGN